MSLLVCSFYAVLSFSGSQDIPVIELEPLVVTASGIVESIEETGSSVTVIDEAELQAQNAVTVAEVLRNVAGLTIQRSGTMGRTTSARLRGANTAHTLVLIDGVRVNDPTLGGFDFMDLTTDGISRIEIVRGPQSSLYGADAVGGVIQIFTRKGKGKPSIHSDLRYGSYGTGRLHLGAQGANERGSLAASIGRLWTDGRFTNDDWTNTTVDASGSLRLGDEAELTVNLRHTTAERGIPIEVFFGVQDFDENSTEEDGHTLASLQFAHRLKPWWKQRIRFSMNRTNRLFLDPLDNDESPQSAFEFASRTRTGMIALDWKQELAPLGSDRGNLVLGGEFRRETGESADPDSGAAWFDDAIRVNSFYAHGDLKVRKGMIVPGDAFSVSGGLRVDRYRRFGTELNPKLALIYRIPDKGWQVHASYATGFKAPSISDFALPFWGNPQIEPEQSQSYEIGAGKALAQRKLNLDIVFFHNRFTNLIAADPILYIAQNIASARSQGVEFQLRSRLREKVWLLLSYTFLDSRESDTGLELLRRPRHKGGLSLNFHPVEALQMYLDATARGKMRDFDVAGMPPGSAGFVKVDLATAYRLPGKGRDLSLFARIENLLDRQYMEIKGYPAPGLNVHGGLRVSF